MCEEPSLRGPQPHEGRSLQPHEGRSIPAEIQFEILGWITDIPDVANCMLVCSEWKTYILIHIKMLRREIIDQGGYKQYYKSFTMIRYAYSYKPHNYYALHKIPNKLGRICIGNVRWKLFKLLDIMTNDVINDMKSLGFKDISICRENKIYIRVYNSGVKFTLYLTRMEFGGGYVANWESTFAISRQLYKFGINMDAVEFSLRAKAIAERYLFERPQCF